MAKITVETKEGPVRLVNQEPFWPTEAETQKVCEVASKTFALLRKIHQSSTVEIIKATAWQDYCSSNDHKSRARVLVVDFQLVFCPDLAPTLKPEEEKLRVVAKWNSGDNKILVCSDVRHEGALDSPRTINLRDGEVETLARALIKAMQVVVCDRQAYLKKLINWLEGADKKLGSLDQTKASA